MSGIEKWFEKLVEEGKIPQTPMNYDTASYKMYVAHLEAENAALSERLKKAVELREPRITVDHWGGLYEVVYEKVQVVSEVYETRSEAEVRVAELKGGKE